MNNDFRPAGAQAAVAVGVDHHAEGRFDVGKLETKRRFAVGRPRAADSKTESCPCLPVRPVCRRRAGGHRTARATDRPGRWPLRPRYVRTPGCPLLRFWGSGTIGRKRRHCLLAGCQPIEVQNDAPRNTQEVVTPTAGIHRYKPERIRINPSIATSSDEPQPGKEAGDSDRVQHIRLAGPIFGQAFLIAGTDLIQMSTSRAARRRPSRPAGRPACPTTGPGQRRPAHRPSSDRKDRSRPRPGPPAAGATSQKEVGGQRRRAAGRRPQLATSSTTATPARPAPAEPFSLVTDSDSSTFSPGAYRWRAPSRQRSTCAPGRQKTSRSATACGHRAVVIHR